MLEGPARTESRRVEFAKIKKLTRPADRNLKPTFERLAKLLTTSAEAAEIQLDVIDGRTTDAWTLSLNGKSASATNQAARRPDVRIIVARKTWQQIAEGERSPMDAYLAGELRVRGDPDLAKRLFKRAAGRGRTDLP